MVKGGWTWGGRDGRAVGRRVRFAAVSALLACGALTTFPAGAAPTGPTPSLASAQAQAPSPGPPPVPPGANVTPPKLVDRVHRSKETAERASGRLKAFTQELEGAHSAEKRIRNDITVAESTKKNAEQQADRAVIARDRAREALSKVAVSSYVGKTTTLNSATAAGAYSRSGGRVDAEVLARAAVQSVRDDYNRANDNANVAMGLLNKAGASYDRTAAKLPGAQAKITSVRERLSEARQQEEDATKAAQEAQAELSAAETELRWLVATAQQVKGAQQGGSTGGSGDKTPTVLGTSFMTASDLLGWYRSTGAHENTTEPMDRVVRYYVHEGTVVGVRADLAFAQSVLETANFTSIMTRKQNFAGVGACDNCADGYGYPNPQVGVRAQMQLLRSYADRNATSSSFGYASTNTKPETLGVRGCCDTWGRLTGVWATDPKYGPQIMEIYGRMLTWTIARRLEAGPGEFLPRMQGNTAVQNRPDPLPSDQPGTVDPGEQPNVNLPTPMSMG